MCRVFRLVEFRVFADRPLWVEIRIPVKVFVFLTALKDRAGMGAERVRAFFHHAPAHLGEAISVPDVRDGLFVYVPQHRVVVTAHGHVAVGVVDLEMCPRMLADEFIQNGASLSWFKTLNSPSRERSALTLPLRILVTTFNFPVRARRAMKIYPLAP